MTLIRIFNLCHAFGRSGRDDWYDVCVGGGAWPEGLSDLACQQMGMSKALATEERVPFMTFGGNFFTLTSGIHGSGNDTVFDRGSVTMIQQMKQAAQLCNSTLTIRCQASGKTKICSKYL